MVYDFWYMVKNIPDNIDFHFLAKDFALKDRKTLKVFISKLFSMEKVSFETVSYIFCTDKYLLGLNEQFLQHDTYTDVITFTLSGKNDPLIAEIYISTERVKENAEFYKTTFTKELHRVMLHGALHLCGYKDKKKSDQLAMRQKEDYYLKRYFVPRGTKN